MPDRIRRLRAWLSSLPDLEPFTLEPASGDASFRRYFRLHSNGISHIVMDAPPEREPCEPFVEMAHRLGAIGLNVPQIHASDLEQGFLLLGDLGVTHYLDVLNPENCDRLYEEALNALILVQQRASVEGLPPYDRTLLHAEMALFREWLLGHHLGLELSSEEEAMLDQLFEQLADSALEQPQCCVLRDYHSRNLMVTPPPNPGILDFQDAVVGPLTYDVVSLLKDCYICWPRAQVEEWLFHYYDLARQAGLLTPVEQHAEDWRLQSLTRGPEFDHSQRSRFLRWFDLMGVQRHLKASGIFARLNHRDGKPDYLKEIPTTLRYIVELGPLYKELLPLQRLLTGRVLPAL